MNKCFVTCMFTYILVTNTEEKFEIYQRSNQKSSLFTNQITNNYTYISSIDLKLFSESPKHQLGYCQCLVKLLKIQVLI
jgi:hypothetical protein